MRASVVVTCLGLFVFGCGERPTPSVEAEPLAPAAPASPPADAPPGAERWGEHLVYRVGAGAGPVLVLLHGYGAPRDDLRPLALRLRATPGLEDARVFLLGAPIELGSGAAWWALPSREERERARQRGDFGEEPVPEGLVEARAKVEDFLDELSRREGVGRDELILGGFSQGAMLSVDVALHGRVAPRAVLALSGAVVGGSTWPRRRDGLSVFVSHGRVDPLLPFVLGERLRDRLATLGADVTFVAFDGPHAIPAEAVDGARAFLSQRLTPVAAQASADDRCVVDTDCHLERRCCDLHFQAVSAEGAATLRRRCAVSSCEAPAQLPPRPAGVRCLEGRCVPR